ncbi:unnamed protein product [Darwinula stevensoni]|uniref:RING-CH-type domain-containing protein n=1 Tax=Darwinula stevensoni TaxID=69355 RepID=A0A7R9ADG2_9CRUS|nr:unnamed protein product [Darwinula stevensoni]CAG0900725.1 unnamed protein product [Darwinula stevensoni]
MVLGRKRLFPLLTMSFCEANCSGRGDCFNGTCVCEVEFGGDWCQDPNRSYFLAFASIFYTVCAVSFLQLIVCMYAEVQRMKTPSFRRAFRVTTQKALYVLIFIAAALRAVYFSFGENHDLSLSSSLLGAYYAVMLTGSSLIVCFWAEVFHIPGVKWERPRFLSKSFIGFVAFNIITYSLLAAELLMLFVAPKSQEHQEFLVQIFNGCYAVLIFIVVVFFLIYGVEVFFKVRGGFLRDLQRNGHALETITIKGKRGREHPETQTQQEQLQPDDGVHEPSEHVLNATVDFGQLHQSRFGLVFQACILLCTVCFLFSDVLGHFWKDKPDQLWILNPKRILKRLDADAVAGESIVHQPGVSAAEDDDRSSNASGDSNVSGLECWICYDGERADAGPLIQPCQCKGGVGAVHHDCLRRWLIEAAGKDETGDGGAMRCRVCDTPYQLEWGAGSAFRGAFPMKRRHWVHTTLLTMVMCVAGIGAWAAFQVQASTGIKLLAVGLALVVHYLCVRFLGFSVIKAYHRAKISAVKILGSRPSEPEAEGQERVITVMATSRLLFPVPESHI